ncbi:MAG: thioredoxin family protein [Acidobacteriota bacterium]
MTLPFTDPLRRLAMLLLVASLASAPSLAAQDSDPGSNGASPSSPAEETKAVSAPADWHSDLTAAVAEAKERGTYVFVDLFADWCSWCHKLEDEVFVAPEFRDYVRTHDLVLLRVDTEDGGEGMRLNARYGGDSLPTSVLLDTDLVRVAAVTGYAPPEQFVARLDAELAAWQGIVAGYDAVLQGDDVDLQRELASDLHARGDARRASALYERVVARVQDGTEAKAWLHYLLADTYRLQGRFDDAASEAERAEALEATLEGTEELAERLDLLSFYMAQDDGDCPGAVASLEHFLREHPRSLLGGPLRQALETLKNDPQCS